MRRRSLLTLGAGAIGATAGCLGALDPGSDADPAGDGERDDTTTEPTETATVRDGGTLSPPADAEHRLYVENLDDETHLVDVEVVAESGAALVAGRYEVRDRNGVEFPALAAWEETYEVRVALPAVETAGPAAFAWKTESCAGSEAPDGSRNASVRIEEGATDLSFVVDACDAIVAGAAVATGPADSSLVAGGTVALETSDRSTTHSTYGCPPALEVDPVDGSGTTVPGASVTAYEDLPALRREEFEAALSTDRLELSSDYDFWVDEAEFVAHEGETYRVSVSVC